MKTLVLLAHPRPDSYCAALAQSYLAGTIAAGADAQLVHLSELQFDPLADPRHLTGSLEPDIIRMQNLVSEADHLVFVYPTWWGTFPALLKAFFDRVFTSGFAFNYQSGKPLPVQLLKGRTAHLVVTMDAPGIWYRLMQKAPGHNAMLRAILGFCGVKTRKVITIDRVRYRSQDWLTNRLKKLEEESRHFHKQANKPELAVAAR